MFTVSVPQGPLSPHVSPVMQASEPQTSSAGPCWPSALFPRDPPAEESRDVPSLVGALLPGALSLSGPRQSSRAGPAGEGGGRGVGAALSAAE